MADIEKLVSGPVGRMIEADAIRWSDILEQPTNEADAVRLLTSMSVAVSLKRIADALVAGLESRS